MLMLRITVDVNGELLDTIVVTNRGAPNVDEAADHNGVRVYAWTCDGQQHGKLVHARRDGWQALAARVMTQHRAMHADERTR